MRNYEYDFPDRFFGALANADIVRNSEGKILTHMKRIRRQIRKNPEQYLTHNNSKVRKMARERISELIRKSQCAARYLTVDDESIRNEAKEKLNGTN